MAAARRVSTTVLPGGRVAVDVPGLTPGQKVDVLVIPQVTGDERRSFPDFLKSLPTTRTASEWEQFERDFQAERDAWDQ